MMDFFKQLYDLTWMLGLLALYFGAAGLVCLIGILLNDIFSKGM